jgi:hypothetical protein
MNEQFLSGEPGPGIATVNWLYTQHIAITGTDSWSVGPVPGEDPARPFLVPQTMYVKMGLFGLENLATETLAKQQVCARLTSRAEKSGWIPSAKNSRPKNTLILAARPSGMVRPCCAPLVGRYYKQHLLTAMVGFTPSRQTDLLRNFTLIQSLEKFHRFLGNSF